MKKQRREDLPSYGGVIIEEKGGLSTWEAIGLVMVGASIMGVATAIALAIVQLSFAFTVAIIAIGLGLGGSLLAGGVANVILAWGQAKALMEREAGRADVDRAKAEAERERYRLERTRLELYASKQDRGLMHGPHEQELMTSHVAMRTGRGGMR